MVSQTLLSEPWAVCRRDPARALNVAALALFGFSISIGPQWVSITTAIVVLVWLVRGRFRRFPGLVAHNPVVRAAVLLFGLFVVGVAYSPIEFSDSLLALKKYRELIMIPLLMSLADDDGERDIAVLGMMAGILFSLALVYADWFGLLGPSYRREPGAFQNRIVFSTLLSFYLFWASHRVVDRSGAWRWFLAITIVAGTIILIYAIGSRTGYVLFVILALLFGTQRWRLKGLAIATLCMAVFLALAFQVSGSFKHRVTQAVESGLTYEPGKRGGSTRARLEQWRVTVEAISQSPVVGHGTGSLSYALKNFSSRSYARPAQPHSEYLLIMVQIGAVGLAALLWLFLTQWRAAWRAPPPWSHLGQGLVVLFAATCAFNSALFNSPEGHLFAFMSAMVFAGPALRTGEDGSM